MLTKLCLLLGLPLAAFAIAFAAIALAVAMLTGVS